MDEQWELHKEEIVSLYRERTAQEVRDHMRQTHSFDATPQQYERRLKKWGVRKNLKAKEWMLIGRRIEKRKAEDKKSELRVDGYPFPPRKVLKAISRYPEGAIERFQREQRSWRSPTPEGCQLLTPVITAVHSPGLSVVFSLNFDKAPLLQFQRFMEQKFVVFQDLVSHLTRDKIGQEVVTIPATEPSQSVQHNTLVFQAVYESSLTLSSSTITRNALGRFFEAIFHITNHTLDNWDQSGSENFRTLFMEVLARMIETPQNKALLLQAISEPNPTFEALIEATFPTALLSGRGDFVRFLIESGRINPNDSIPMASGAYSPMEVVVRKRNFTMAELLIDLGADPRKGFSDHYDGSSLNDLVNSATPEFLQKILVKWYANNFDAPPVFCKHEQYREVLLKLLKEAVDLRQISTASMQSTSEDTKFALSALQAAISTNDLQSAATIITACKHRELEFMNETEYGLVFSAVEVGSMDMVCLLLKSGADVNVPGPHSISPLTMAILGGELYIAKLLMDYGASIERCYSRTGTAPTPLQAAAYQGFYEIASILISRGADVEAAPSTISNFNDGRLNQIVLHLEYMRARSALEIAVFCGQNNRLELVQLLVESGADADACLDDAMDFSCQRYRIQTTDTVFRYLLTVCSSYSIGNAIYTAIKLGFTQSLRFISEREVNTTGHTSSFEPYLSSTVNCTSSELQLEMVSRLLRQGIELKLSDNQPMRFDKDFRRANPTLAEFLLQNGAYVSVFQELEDGLSYDNGVEKASEKLLSAPPHPTLLQDSCFGHSTLVFLSKSRFRRFDLIRGLLKWGVRVDFPCVIPTVSHICSHGTMEDLRMFLSLGAPVNLERDFECGCWYEIFGYDDDGETLTYSPLQIAARNGRTDMVEVLLRAGASVDFIREAYAGETDFTPISSVYHHTIDFEYTCESTLSISVEGGLQTVEMILAAGADVNEAPHELGGRTALQKAAQVGDIEIVEYLLRKQQADVNAAPAEWRGITALQAAAINSHIDIAHMLLEMGADPNAPGAEEEGRTALEGAAEGGRIDMIQLLLDNGADVTSADFGAVQLENAIQLARDEGFHAAARMLERHRDNLASTL